MKNNQINYFYKDFNYFLPQVFHFMLCILNYLLILNQENMLQTS